MVHVYKGINTCIIICISWYCKITSVKGLEMLFLYYKKKIKKIQDQREHPALSTLTRTLLSKNSFFLMFSGHLLYIEKWTRLFGQLLHFEWMFISNKYVYFLTPKSDEKNHNGFKVAQDSWSG